MKMRSLHGWMCSSQHLGSVAEQVSLQFAALPLFWPAKRQEVREERISNLQQHLEDYRSHLQTLMDLIEYLLQYSFFR